VTHGQCDARPTVTFPAARHHRPLTGTKLYCSVTEAHACEQLAQGCYLKAQGRESNPRPSESQVQPLTITPPGRTLQRPQVPIIVLAIGATHLLVCYPVNARRQRAVQCRCLMLTRHDITCSPALLSATRQTTHYGTKSPRSRTCSPATPPPSQTAAPRSDAP